MKSFATYGIVIWVICGVLVKFSFAKISESNNEQVERFESPYDSYEVDFKTKDSCIKYNKNQKGEDCLVYDKEANTFGHLCTVPACDNEITDNGRLLSPESCSVVSTESPIDNELDSVLLGASNNLSTEKGTCETRIISGNRKLTCTVDKVDSVLSYKCDDTYAKAEYLNTNHVNARSSLPNYCPGLSTESPADNEVDSELADALVDLYKETYKINEFEKNSLRNSRQLEFTTDSPADNEVDSVFSDSFDAVNPLKEEKTESVNINSKVVTSASGNEEGNSPNIDGPNRVPEKDEQIKKEYKKQKNQDRTSGYRIPKEE